MRGVGIVLGDFEVQGLALETLAADIDSEYGNGNVTGVLGDEVDGVGSCGGHALGSKDRIDRGGNAANHLEAGDRRNLGHAAGRNAFEFEGEDNGFADDDRIAIERSGEAGLCGEDRRGGDKKKGDQRKQPERQFAPTVAQFSVLRTKHSYR